MNSPPAIIMTSRGTLYSIRCIAPLRDRWGRSLAAECLTVG